MPRPLPSRRLSRIALRGDGVGGSSRDRRRLRRLIDRHGLPDLFRPTPRRRYHTRGRWAVYSPSRTGPCPECGSPYYCLHDIPF